MGNIFIPHREVSSGKLEFYNLYRLSLGIRGIEVSGVLQAA
jgi:hypothetical protein